MNMCLKCRICGCSLKPYYSPSGDLADTGDIIGYHCPSCGAKWETKEPDTSIYKKIKPQTIIDEGFIKK